MKILRVASDVYPDVMGGVGLHVHEMSKIQSKLGHEVTVLTSDHGDRSKSAKETRDGYQLIRHRELISPVDNSIFPGLVRTLYQISNDYDIIHAHSHLFFSTNLSAVFRKVNETPLIVTNHGLMSQTAPKWLQKVFIPTIAKFTFESADRVLCYTNTDKRRLQERGIKTNIKVIHNGIDCDKFDIYKKNDNENLQILFVGRLKPGKGVDDLLVAFEDVVTEFPGVKLTIVGDGPLRDELIEKAKTKTLYSNVEFIGQISNDDMPNVYAESDLFVLPSSNEGLPRTVLESMACGTPVITSSLPQLEPIVDSAGLTVEHGRPKELAKRIKYLLSHPEERNRMGEVGRAKVENEFSWEETVRKTLSVYEEIINESDS